MLELNLTVSSAHAELLCILYLLRLAIKRLSQWARQAINKSKKLTSFNKFFKWRAHFHMPYIIKQMFFPSHPQIQWVAYFMYFRLKTTQSPHSNNKRILKDLTCFCISILQRLDIYYHNSKSNNDISDVVTAGFLKY